MRSVSSVVPALLLLYLFCLFPCFSSCTNEEPDSGSGARLIQETILSSSRDPLSVVTYEYNRHGGIKAEEFGPFHAPWTSRVVYRYGPGGQIRKAVFFEKPLFSSGSKKFHYDDKGRLVSIVDVTGFCRASGSETLYEYDEEGRIIREEYVSGEGKMVLVRGFAGDLVVTEESFSGSGSSVGMRSYIYDDENHLCEIEHYDGAGDLTRRELFVCDEAGNTVEKQVLRGAEVVSISEYIYQ